MVVERILAKTPIGANQTMNPILKPSSACTGPDFTSGNTTMRQPASTDKQSRGLGCAVVIVLSYSVGNCRSNTLKMFLDQVQKARECLVHLAQNDGGHGQMHNSDGCLLPTFPVGSQIGRIFLAPVGYPLIQLGNRCSIADDCALSKCQRPVEP